MALVLEHAARLLYFLLAALDPEIAEHFKVLADFENDLPRTPENEAILARLLATIARREGLNGSTTNESLLEWSAELRVKGPAEFDFALYINDLSAAGSHLTGDAGGMPKRKSAKLG